MSAGNPTDLGFTMPAEWESHAGCLMSWPTRRELWGTSFNDATLEYSQVAITISEFEPVVIVCAPSDESTVLAMCGSDVSVLTIPINDSWIRDNGPIFVRDQRGANAIVAFGFNAWGERWRPYDDDAKVAGRIGEILELPVFDAPFVLEGGSFVVDGDGTLLTTEQCLLNPNRNPSLSKPEIEEGLRSFLGVESIVWLPHGLASDDGPAGTDGHVDLVAQWKTPGHVVLYLPNDPSSPDFARMRENFDVCRRTKDARGRELQISVIDAESSSPVAYLNYYLANHAVIVPMSGDDSDADALDQIAGIYPEREVVGVNATTIASGGGGPHCITQQIPQGVRLPR